MYNSFNNVRLFYAGKENVVSISCPIRGEYTGKLPDAPQFCAKLSSDCNNPNIMFYTVNGCSESSAIFDGKGYKEVYTSEIISIINRWSEQVC